MSNGAANAGRQVLIIAGGILLAALVLFFAWWWWTLEQESNDRETQERFDCIDEQINDPNAPPVDC